MRLQYPKSLPRVWQAQNPKTDSRENVWTVGDDFRSPPPLDAVTKTFALQCSERDCVAEHQSEEAAWPSVPEVSAERRPPSAESRVTCFTGKFIFVLYNIRPVSFQQQEE